MCLQVYCGDFGNYAHTYIYIYVDMCVRVCVWLQKLHILHQQVCLKIGVALLPKLVTGPLNELMKVQTFQQTNRLPAVTALQ